MQKIHTLFGSAMKKKLRSNFPITKSLPMWPKGSIIIAQFFKYKIMINQNRRSFLCYKGHQNVKFLSLVTEALTGLIYLRAKIPVQQPRSQGHNVEVVSSVQSAGDFVNLIGYPCSSRVENVLVSVAAN